MRRSTSMALQVLLPVLALTGGRALAAPVTYDFTGTVYLSNGGFAGTAVGSGVTGSFTIDTAAGIPASGTVGSASNWELTSNGGSQSGTAVPSEFVFSLTATVGTNTYTAGTSSYLNNVSLAGAFGELNGRQQTSSADSPELTVNSEISLVSDATFSGSGPLPYLSNGLPNLAAINLGSSTGMFDTILDVGGVVGEFGYSLNSLTPISAVPPGGVPVNAVPSVPLPGSWSLLLTGLLALGASLKRHANAGCRS